MSDTVGLDTCFILIINYEWYIGNAYPLDSDME